MSIGPASEQWRRCSDEGLIYLKSNQLNLIIINYPGTYVICYELVSRSGAQLILLKSNFSIIETGISAWAVKGLLAGKLVFFHVHYVHDKGLETWLQLTWCYFENISQLLLLIFVTLLVTWWDHQALSHKLHASWSFLLKHKNEYQKKYNSFNHSGRCCYSWCGY